MMQAYTKTPSINDIKREWHLVDVKGEVLGRIAGEIALLLMGKKKPYFVRNLDCGDYVVVINAASVRVTGRKEDLKTYYRHSMYPGGFRAETLKDLRERRPETVIEHAVKGMLPQNKLRASMLKRLLIFPGEEHEFKSKIKNQKAKVE